MNNDNQHHNYNENQINCNLTANEKGYAKNFLQLNERAKNADKNQ